MTEQTLQQRLSIITIGARDLPAMRSFYVDQFGWQPVAENKDIIFFKLNGLLFGLYGSDNMAKFNHKEWTPAGFRPYNLAYMVPTEAAVEELYTALQRKGVKIIHPPEVPPIGGCYFLLEDVEGNVWEIACNPFMPLDKEGNVITHTSISHL